VAINTHKADYYSQADGLYKEDDYSQPNVCIKQTIIAKQMIPAESKVVDFHLCNYVENL
jgi:hypothetical protein